MGTDLGKVMKVQRLSEEKIQYLVYQMLKGLKVLGLCIIYIIGVWIWGLKLFLFFCFFNYTVYSFCWYNSQGELSFIFICAMTRFVNISVAC